MSTLVTKTKIIMPGRRSDLLTRPRLTELLYENIIDHRITIVAAPAGYGKTSLAIDLAHKTDLPFCWYALDEIDNDLPRFLTHFIASISHRYPQFGQQSMAVLQREGHNEFDLDRIVSTLINELYEQVREHFALVLDDYHLVDDNQEIGEFIIRFTQSVGDNCHLAILSRTLLSLRDLPLMIARSQVSGLDFTELAFRPEEIQALVLKNYSLTLPDAEAETLAKETEGWITGLLLSTQTMWEGVSKRVQTAKVSGVGIFDYLAQQVFEQQDPPTQDFLMRTSFLEEFDAQLCREVFEDDQNWEKMIADLLQDNLFILPVGGDDHWLRYHHLFRDFLQTQLRQQHPEEPARILGRLATVFSQRKEWEKAHAIYQRLDDPESTADLIDRARASLMRNGRWRTLAEWLDTLPKITFSSRPGLVSARGIVAVMQGEIEHGLQFLNQAAYELRNNGDPNELAYTLERRAFAHLFSGDYQAALADAEQALSLVDNNPALEIVQAQSLQVKASSLKHLGQMDTTLDNLNKAISIFEKLDYQDDLAIINTELGAVYHEIGAYEQAIETYQNAIDHFQQTGNIVNLALTLNNAGVTYHALGDYEHAAEYFDKALQFARQTNYKYAEACALSSIGDVYADLEAPDAARKVYQDARQVAKKIQNRFLMIYLELAEADLAYMQDEINKASEFIQSAKQLVDQDDSSYEQALYQLGAGKLAFFGKNAPQAQVHFSNAVCAFEAGNQRTESGRARFHLSLAHYTAGQVETALEEFVLAFEATPELSSQHVLVMANKVGRALLETARERPSTARQASQMLRQLDEFESNVTPLRQSIRKQVAMVPFAPPHLTIRAFGEGQVLLNGEPATSQDWASRKPVRDFLFCLLAHPRGLTKEEIGLIFWPNSSKSQLKLRFKNNIYWLRHALGQEVVLYEDNLYRFNFSSDYEYDVETFKQSINQAQESRQVEEKITAFQKAIDLYRDDYLIYTDQDWVLLEREHLRQTFLETGLELSQLKINIQDYQGTLETSQRLLEENPCLEAAHRLKMRAYAALEDRGAVARQYEICSDCLNKELNIQPSQKTKRLYEILMQA